MATIFIPAQLRELTAGIEHLEMDVHNVRDVINQLEQRFPSIRDRLCQQDQISPSLQVSIDSVITSRGMIAKIQPDSEVHFIPAIAGG
ncbi:MAG: MoaD/ThiS family protein [Planctomycetaceae bacterium]|jgi:sulfur-carrier protein|nr:MoaD/ThiS family protein [Planctomycetaceae bacterium]MBT4013987.1 MoaD/ThiS family protein [Planctomycetaceae bacterium]MBT4726062.1 MoaD/ThiS family protein [Planctomycetaceae bacterium]MBT4846065.1 MoaD/ThiS family protein [Planctomycetaceae bacterium]MBT5124178.1 MoaD/ThiS family protein [Planctomycetaceae bacterium]